MKTINNEFVFPLDGKECHASTVLALDDGSVLVSYFYGTAEGKNDVCIYVAKKEKGKNFGVPKRVSPDDGIPHWNPVLAKKNENDIILFFKVGLKPKNWHTEYMISSDGGETFTEPKVLVENDKLYGRGPVKNKLIVMSNGEWLAPTSTEVGEWKCFMDISADEGKTWTASEIIALPPTQEEREKLRGIIQPTLWESEKGKIHALFRSTEGFIYRSNSDDYGKHWSEPYAIPIANNNSGLDVVRMDNGELYLVCNPCGNSAGDVWGLRSPLTLFKSTDNGETWSEATVLVSGAGKEYSYPCIIADGKYLHIAYTWNRKLIYYLKIELD